MTPEEKVRLDKILGVESPQQSIPVMTPQIPDAKYSENRRILDEKRTELELKKLEAEIAKIAAPTTNIDYFAKMLELQEKNNKQLMEMMDRQHKLELEMVRSQFSDDDPTMRYIEMLAPYLPQLLGRGEAPSSVEASSGAYAPQTESSVPKTSISQGEQTQPTEEEKQMNLEQYKQAIRDGKINFETAWIDFQREMPDMAKKMTKDQFFKVFEDIKAGKA